MCSAKIMRWWCSGRWGHCLAITRTAWPWFEAGRWKDIHSSLFIRFDAKVVQRCPAWIQIAFSLLFWQSFRKGLAWSLRSLGKGSLWKGFLLSTWIIPPPSLSPSCFSYLEIVSFLSFYLHMRKCSYRLYMYRKMNTAHFFLKRRNRRQQFLLLKTPSLGQHSNFLPS